MVGQWKRHLQQNYRGGNNMIKLYNGNCREIIQSVKPENCIVVTDPPFNVGYHYNSYNDRMPETEYFKMLDEVLQGQFVVIHYPEEIYKIAIQKGVAPQKVVSWVYNSNTGKQHRDIAFFNIKPDFTKVRQPYKNPNDKRIAERIKNGAGGGVYMIGGKSIKLKTSARKRPNTLVKCR